jgi:hypothetical protein
MLYRAISALSLVALPAAAADYSLTGYGTLGYAKSDQPFAYQRFIDNDGTFKRDSVVGAQVDARFDSQFAATLQVKAAPSASSDSQYDATVAWAFLSYRPTNEWLLRVGKLRLPLYLYSENADIGATFDFARLPTEIYSISPTKDFAGAFLGKRWSLDLGELTLNGYSGKAKAYQRYYSRDGVPGGQSKGPYFVPIDVSASGLTLTLERDDDIYHFGFNRAITSKSDGLSISRSYPFVTVLPGVGYYQISSKLPGPGVPTTNDTVTSVITVGASVDLGAGVRVIGEYAKRLVRNTEIGPNSDGGHLSVLKRLSRWTLYGTYAYLRSAPETRSTYNAINYNKVPATIPGASQINASQRAAAEGIVAFDQSSWALGTSYALTANSKIKTEIQRARIGEMSFLVDAPTGGNVRDQNINVYSLSYSFAF